MCTQTHKNDPKGVTKGEKERECERESAMSIKKIRHLKRTTFCMENLPANDLPDSLSHPPPPAAPPSIPWGRIRAA